MRIGVDFDDILGDCNSALLKWHNKTHGTCYQYEDICVFDFAQVWGVSPQEAMGRFAAFIESPEHYMMQPVKHARESIEILEQHADLFVVTGRQENTDSITREWLERHFPNKFRDVIFTNHFGGTVEQKVESKGDVCSRLELDVFVDDAPHHAESIAITHTRILLLDAPWNREPMHPKIERVYSWQEIPPLLLRI